MTSVPANAASNVLSSSSFTSSAPLDASAWDFSEAGSRERIRIREKEERNSVTNALLMNVPVHAQCKGQ